MLKNILEINRSSCSNRHKTTRRPELAVYFLIRRIKALLSEMALTFLSLFSSVYVLCKDFLMHMRNIGEHYDT